MPESLKPLIELVSQLGNLDKVLLNTFIVFNLFVLKMEIEFLVLNILAPIFFKISISHLRIFGFICLKIIFLPINAPATK